MIMRFVFITYSSRPLFDCRNRSITDLFSISSAAKVQTEIFQTKTLKLCRLYQICSFQSHAFNLIEPVETAAAGPYQHISLSSPQ